jgi:hypothetical protein
MQLHGTALHGWFAKLAMPTALSLPLAAQTDSGCCIMGIAPMDPIMPRGVKGQTIVWQPYCTGAHKCLWSLARLAGHNRANRCRTIPSAPIPCLRVIQHQWCFRHRADDDTAQFGCRYERQHLTDATINILKCSVRLLAEDKA